MSPPSLASSEEGLCACRSLGTSGLSHRDPAWTRGTYLLEALPPYPFPLLLSTDQVVRLLSSETPSAPANSSSSRGGFLEPIVGWSSKQKAHNIARSCLVLYQISSILGQDFKYPLIPLFSSSSVFFPLFFFFFIPTAPVAIIFFIIFYDPYFLQDPLFLPILTITTTSISPPSFKMFIVSLLSSCNVCLVRTLDRCVDRWRPSEYHYNNSYSSSSHQ